MQKPPLVLAIAGLALLGFGVAVGAATGALTLKPFNKGDVVHLLQVMFVVALFLERSLEVFINAWRGEGKALIASDVRAAQRALDAAAAGALAIDFKTALDTLDAADKSFNIYKAETKRIAMCAAVVAGVLISAAGLRSFEVFLVPRSGTLNSWERIAAVLFGILNVLITGGLLGGGSDLIHKILKVITDFLDTTSKLIVKRAPQP